MYRTWLRFALFVFIAMSASSALGAVYQWSVTVDRTVTSTKPEAQPRAFLWVPPNCLRVRGVVLAEQNMLEEGILESVYFRQTLSDLCLGEIWVSPSFDLVFQFDRGAGDRVDKMMLDLASESGYSELAFAPIAPMGHSAHASFPWNFAAWNSGRTLAVLSVHGDAPLTNRTGSGRPNPPWGDRNIDGVPGLMVMGEYEWATDRLTPASDYVKQNPRTPLSFLADSGHGHFDHSDQLIRFLSLYLRKAVFYRLPKDAPVDGPVKLHPIDPRGGWLVDQWRHGAKPSAPPAPYATYAGNRYDAFWAFDKEIADANANYNDAHGRLPQLLGFEQSGQFIDQNSNLQQVNLKFEPDADGISFHVYANFIDTVPHGNPEKWSGLPAGAHIDHATGGGPVMVSRIAGAMIETGAQDFAVSFNRGTDVTDMNKTTDGLWFVATQDGDDRYKSAVQQAQMVLPMRYAEGATQKITFPAIPDQTNLAAVVALAATSDAHVPVSYYVREGPAEVEGDHLRLTAIPPQAKYPIKVTVIAWQYGRSIGVKLQSAKPVVQTFLIQK